MLSSYRSSSPRSARISSKRRAHAPSRGCRGRGKPESCRPLRAARPGPSSRSRLWSEVSALSKIIVLLPASLCDVAATARRLVDSGRRVVVDRGRARRKRSQSKSTPRADCVHSRSCNDSADLAACWLELAYRGRGPDHRALLGSRDWPLTCAHSCR